MGAACVAYLWHTAQYYTPSSMPLPVFGQFDITVYGHERHPSLQTLFVVKPWWLRVRHLTMNVSSA